MTMLLKSNNSLISSIVALTATSVMDSKCQALLPSLPQTQLLPQHVTQHVTQPNLQSNLPHNARHSSILLSSPSSSISSSPDSEERQDKQRKNIRTTRRKSPTSSSRVGKVKVTRRKSSGEDGTIPKKPVLTISSKVTRATSSTRATTARARRTTQLQEPTQSQVESSAQDSSNNATTVKGTQSKPTKSNKRSKSTNYQQQQPMIQQMMDHTILTKEEEVAFGRQVVQAREVNERLESLVEERKLMELELELERELQLEKSELGLGQEIGMNGDFNLGDDGSGLGLGSTGLNGMNGQSQVDLDYEFLSYELEYLSMYGYRPSWSGNSEKSDFYGEGASTSSTAAAADSLLEKLSKDGSSQGLFGSDSISNLSSLRSIYSIENNDHLQHKKNHLSQIHQHFSSGPSLIDTRNSSSNRRNKVHTNGEVSTKGYTPLLHLHHTLYQLTLLTDDDVATHLQIPGGKKQILQILLDGAYGREVLMRRNVKLVMSIAKQWMRNSYTTKNANLGGSAGGGGKGGGKGSGAGGKGRSNGNSISSKAYEGSWDRPSLDEAVQEGMLGLARAVDKFDPERGLRFSTYATHWITSYVRVCFQRAATGCLRVPSQLHDIKSAYQKIVKEHLNLGESVPAKKLIAQKLGVSERRLTTAIRATGGLLSVDAPIIAPGSGSFKGSAAGGEGNAQELLILDTLKCAEPKPEDQVEISFLRQCLENAMATELTPYERDILRLRLGLDSGEGKTVREIVDICGGSVTMSDVRSAERRAFKKLRSPTSVHTHNLLAYLDFADADQSSLLRR